MLEDFTEIGAGLQDLLVEILPRATMALLVLVVGYLLARVAKALTTRLLRRAGRWLSGRTGQLYIDLPVATVGVVIFWFILLVTSLVVAKMLNFTLVTTGIESLLAYLPNLAAATLTVLLAYVGGRFLANLVLSVSRRMRIPYGQTLGRVIQYCIVFIALVIAIDQIGVEISFFINIVDIVLAALLFGAALAFGLGARTSISNILAIFYLRKVYSEGDEIRIGGVVGKIRKFDATAVIVDTEEGQYLVPAKEFGERHSLLLKKH